MKAGDRVRCIDAKEHGIPIKEGEVYTVKSAFRRYAGAEINHDKPGVYLVEEPGVFLQSRFEAVGDTP